MNALALLFLSSSAADAAVPAPTWGTEPVRYHVETELLLPRGVRVAAVNNLDARLRRLKVVADAECLPKRVGKNTELTCKLAWLGFEGDAWENEQEKLDRILAEWVKMLTPVRITMFMGPDGRLKEFDIDGVERSNARSGYLIEYQRVLLHRAFSALDLPLPADEKDWIRGWEQKGEVIIARLPTTTGTVGATQVRHRFAGERQGLAYVATEGKATITEGSAADSLGNHLVDVRLAGEAQYDVVTGAMLFRAFSMEGRLTASSVEVGTDVYIYQTSAIQRVDAFLPEGKAPLPLSAQRAPRREAEPPPLAEGLELVAFESLGMQPLFVQGLPDAATELQLPTSSVKARVVVASDGHPVEVTVFEGYEALIHTGTNALKGASFPAREAPYAVDVSLEFRP